MNRVNEFPLPLAVEQSCVLVRNLQLRRVVPSNGATLNTPALNTQNRHRLRGEGKPPPLTETTKRVVL